MTWNRDGHRWWCEFGESDNPFFRCPASVTRRELETRALYGGNLTVYEWEVQPPLGSNRSPVRGKANTKTKAMSEAEQEAKALLMLQSK